MINLANTSQKLACGGHTPKENSKSQRLSTYLECGYTANADMNGTRNLLAAGKVALVCGEMMPPGCSVEQEPAETTQTPA